MSENLASNAARQQYRPGMQAWLCAIGAWLFHLMGCVSLSMMTSIQRAMAEEFAAGDSFRSALTSVFVLGNLILALPMGSFITKHGYRKIGYASFVFGVIGGLFGAYACNSAAAMLLCRLIQSVSYTIPVLIGSWIITSWFPADKQGLAIGLYGSAPALGSFIPLRVYNMIKGINPDATWRSLFVFCAVLNVVAFVFYQFWVKPGPLFSEDEHNEKEAAKAAAKAAAPKARFSDIVKVPEIWCCVIIMFLYSVTIKGFMPFSSEIFMDNCGCDELTANNISSVWAGVKVFAPIIFGFLWGKTRKFQGWFACVYVAIYFMGLAVAFQLSSVSSAWLFCAFVGATAGVPAFLYCILPIFAGGKDKLTLTLTLYSIGGTYFGGLLGPYMITFAKMFGDGGFGSVAVFTLVCGVVAVIAAAYLAIRIQGRIKTNTWPAVSAGRRH